MKPAKRVFPPLPLSLLLTLTALHASPGSESSTPKSSTLVSITEPAPARIPSRNAWLYSRRRWDAEIGAFRKADAEQGVREGGVLFVGSSSIRLWSTLAEDFPGQVVANRGFGGSVIPDCVEYVDDLVTPHQPRQIVFYCGGNDLAALHPPEVVAENFAVFVEEARKRVPGVRVAFISIAPNPARWGQVDRVREANRRIARYCREGQGLEFIDVFPAMLTGEGVPRGELFREDGLHMNREGYRLWARLVGPALERNGVSAR